MENQKQKISRRDFLKMSLGTLVLGGCEMGTEPEKSLFKDITGDGKIDMVYQIEFNETYDNPFYNNPVYFVLFKENIGEGKYGKPNLLKISNEPINTIPITEKILYKDVRIKLHLPGYQNPRDFDKISKRRNISNEQLIEYFKLTK